MGCVDSTLALGAFRRTCIFSNSVPLSEAAQKSSRIKSLSIAKLMADAIRSIHEETSVSTLFV